MNLKKMLESLVDSTVSVEDFKNCGKIDVCNLVEECSRQAHLYAVAAKLLCEAKSVFRAAKANFELTKAEVESDIRRNPSEYGLDKVTEASIISTATKTEEVIKARDFLLEASDRVDEAEVLVSVLDQKRSMLNNEVQMALSERLNLDLPSRKVVEMVEREIIERRQNRGKGND
jgi:hypothetical protein